MIGHAELQYLRTVPCMLQISTDNIRQQLQTAQGSSIIISVCSVSRPCSICLWSLRSPAGDIQYPNLCTELKWIDYRYLSTVLHKCF